MRIVAHTAEKWDMGAFRLSAAAGDGARSRRELKTEAEVPGDVQYRDVTQ